MVDIPFPLKTYGEAIFEKYFSSFEGRYVMLQKTISAEDKLDDKPFEFMEVMVWVA